MTFEAIYLHRRVTMAAHTKIILALGHTAGLFACVAVDTFLEAVLLGSDAFDDRFITVMIQDFHVVSPHVVSIFYTLLTFDCLGNNWL